MTLLCIAEFERWVSALKRCVDYLVTMGNILPGNSSLQKSETYASGISTVLQNVNNSLKLCYGEDEAVLLS